MALGASGEALGGLEALVEQLGTSKPAVIAALSGRPPPHRGAGERIGGPDRSARRWPLSAASLDTELAKDILGKTQKQWDDYRLCLPDKNKGVLTDYPFVKFKVEQGGKQFVLDKYFFSLEIK